MPTTTPTAHVIHADALTALRDLPDNSIDAIVTDPPYGLAALDATLIAGVMARWLAGERDAAPTGRGFLGKSWDAFIPPPAIWDEALRVLKPGGHLLSFAGSRTVDLMGLSIRLAGFEIRDQIQWIYGSGFPKSHDVSKAIDKTLGAEREVVGRTTYAGGHVQNSNVTMGYSGNNPEEDTRSITAPATPDATTWAGWGTALKPAHEPIVVARKPFSGTVAANVLAYGTGALNIDASRVPTDERMSYSTSTVKGVIAPLNTGTNGQHAAGRFPANIIFDEDTAAILDEQAPNASRFFYVAKAPKSERPRVDGVAHPTVKPLALMRYLVKLVTPPGGTVLDPFAGSGTTLEAAGLEGFDSIGIDMTAEYIGLIEARLARAGVAMTVDRPALAA